MDPIKEEMRKQIYQIRNTLSLAELTASNDAIMNRIAGLPEYRMARTVFIYIGHAVDLNTLPLIEDALQAGKRVIAPHYLSPTEMSFCQIQRVQDLKYSRVGLLEPRWINRTVDHTAINFAVVPSICCDKVCNRLDFGIGIYNRYLSKGWLYPAVSPCRDIQMLERMLPGSTDIPVDMVVTESAVYHRRYAATATG